MLNEDELKSNYSVLQYLQNVREEYNTNQNLARVYEAESDCKVRPLILWKQTLHHNTFHALSD